MVLIGKSPDPLVLVIITNKSKITTCEVHISRLNIAHQKNSYKNRRLTVYMNVSNLNSHQCGVENGETYENKH